MAKKIKVNGRIGDLSIPLLVAILVIFGTIMVFSASYYYSISEYSNPYVYLKKQIMWVLVGTIAMAIASKIDYHFWARLWIIAPVICLITLCLIFTPLGQEVNGATRWIGVGGFTFMPGEFAKAGMILFVTGYFSRYPSRAKSFAKGIMPVVMVACIFGVLIMKQPNMSTAFTIIFIAGGMLIVAGIKWLHTGVLVSLAGVAAAGYIFLDTGGYRHKRFTSFLDPFEDALGDGWQVVQSLLALGTGGLTGRGLGNSIQKHLYLPEAQNDFILAIIGEEVGFVGVLGVILVYILLIWRGFHVALNAKDYTGMMLASGITIMLAVQVIINIAVVTSSMPPTGIILPFISYGGNALLLFMGAFGILWNISKSSNV